MSGLRSPIKRYVTLLTLSLMLVTAVAVAFLFQHEQEQMSIRNRLTDYHMASINRSLEAKDFLRNISEVIIRTRNKGVKFERPRENSESVSIALTHNLHLANARFQTLERIQSDFPGNGLAPATERLLSQFNEFNRNIDRAPNSITDTIRLQILAGQLKKISVSIEQFVGLHQIDAERLSEKIKIESRDEYLTFIAVSAILFVLALFALWHVLRLIEQNLRREREATRLSVRQGRILEESLNEIYILDAETLAFVDINRGALDNLGYTKSELIGLNPADIKPNFTRDSYSEQIKPIQTGEFEVLTAEDVHQRKDGTTYPVSIRRQIFKDGDTTLLVAFINDITDQKRAENEILELNATLEERVARRTKELRESEQQIQTILDNSPLGIGILEVSDSGTKVVLANPEWAEIYRSDRETLMSEELQDAWVNPSARRDTINRAMSGETVRNEAHQFRRPDGSLFWVLLTFRLVTFKGKPALMFWLYDISDQKNAEHALQGALENLKTTQDSLVESEKMASLGGLVAGVAHEINTPVGVGMTASSHLSDSTTAFMSHYRDGSMTRSELESFLHVADESSRIIMGNMQRAADLIRSFKQVAVDQSDNVTRSINLKEYVEEVMLSLQPKFKRSKIEVKVEIPPDVLLETQPGAISQILTNLLVNSLTHGFEAEEEGTINISAHEANDKILISYEDNGKGMTEDVRKRIFEPFFTTRRGAGGSGLGMHLLYNLVSQSLHGRVTCKSILGEGARFDIEFPSKLLSGPESETTTVVVH